MSAVPKDDAARAARAALDVPPDADLAAIEAAFRRRVAPLAAAAHADPAASEGLRRLIEARALLRRVAQEPAPRAAPPRRAPSPTGLRPRGFRLAPDGRDVEVEVAIDDLVAAAATGALDAALIAPVLRRCPVCRAAGRAACAHCGGAGVRPQERLRAIPLDLERIAGGDRALDAAAFSDALGRAARREPQLRLRPV